MFRMKTKKFGLILLVGLAISGIAFSEMQRQASLWVGQFSKASTGESFPEGWKAVTFKNIPEHTQYRLVEDEGRVVVKATSQSAASGLGKKVRIESRDYPYIHWSWKIANTLTKSKIGQKAGDDFPARIYITFEYDPEKATFFETFEHQVGKTIFGEDLPASSLAYIWATSEPVETLAPNPYTDRLRMIVVQSGQQNLNKWIEEKRDLYRDYKKAFGKEPTAVSSIVIMTDTDNTKGSAVAYYGDIYLTKK